MTSTALASSDCMPDTLSSATYAERFLKTTGRRARKAGTGRLAGSPSQACSPQRAGMAPRAKPPPSSARAGQSQPCLFLKQSGLETTSPKVQSKPRHTKATASASPAPSCPARRLLPCLWASARLTTSLSLPLPGAERAEPPRWALAFGVARRQDNTHSPLQCWWPYHQ